MTGPALGWVRWSGYGLLSIALILVGISVLYTIRARVASIYIIRQRALRRAQRWMLASVIALGVALLLLLLPSLLALVLPQPLPPPSPTATPSSTPTPRPTSTPTVTPTPRPTATPPFIPTSTPEVPLPASLLTPLPSAVPAGSDARLAIITLAAGVDGTGQPVDTGVQFPAGDHYVYLFFSYRGMSEGVAWTFAVYRERELLDSFTQLWPWGPEGRTYIYYKPPEGYRPGVYEMRLFIEDRLQGIAQFTIGD